VTGGEGHRAVLTQRAHKLENLNTAPLHPSQILWYYTHNLKGKALRYWHKTIVPHALHTGGAGAS
jgi:hypothetical protein